MLPWFKWMQEFPNNGTLTVSKFFRSKLWSIHSGMFWHQNVWLQTIYCVTRLLKIKCAWQLLVWSEHVTQSDSKFWLWKCEYCGLNEPKWKKAALFTDNSFLNSNSCGPWIVTWIVPFTVNQRSVVVFSITGIQICFFFSVLVASSSLTLPCEGHGWQRWKLRFFSKSPVVDLRSQKGRQL